MTLGQILLIVILVLLLGGVGHSTNWNIYPTGGVGLLLIIVIILLLCRVI